MLRLCNDVLITLEVLDAGGGVLSGTAAALLHLDEEFAIVSLPPQTSVPCLHWGAKVRFWVGEGKLGYEVIGVVIAQERPGTASDVREGENAAAEPHQVRIRLFECHLRPQRRNTPRRRTRITVRYRPVATLAGGVSEQNGGEGEKTSNPEEWLAGSCVDISGGGMRLSGDRLAETVKFLLLKFTLPAISDAEGDGQARAFCVQGRILRCTDSKRRAGRVEMAVKFERLSAEDGRALSAFLEWSGGAAPAAQHAAQLSPLLHL